MIVGVRVIVGVRLGVRVTVDVRVLVGLEPKVGVALGVGVTVLVGVEEGVGVSVGVGVAVSGARVAVGCGVGVGGMIIERVETRVDVEARPICALREHPASKISASAAVLTSRKQRRNLSSLFNAKGIDPPGPYAVWATKIIVHIRAFGTNRKGPACRLPGLTPAVFSPITAW